MYMYIHTVKPSTEATLDGSKSFNPSRKFGYIPSLFFHVSCFYILCLPIFFPVCFK